ncbi:zinc transporter ZIP1-like [Ptychodera flava]|uniref:zinc transporter ZIP1-like n=1 Tax=Ptychodera flava TaxID=63121 RepID=UPI00396A6CD1
MKLTVAFSAHNDPTRKGNAPRFLRLMSCFAGGVFLSTCLLDLLPEVQAGFTKVFEDSRIQIDYPIAELVIIIGFLLVLTVEQTVLSCEEKHRLPSTNVMNMPLLDIDSSDDESVDNRNTEFSARLRSFALLIALSLHSLFEGLAVGLRNESTGVVRLFTAVAIHKCILAFSLGLKMVQSKLSRCTILGSCLCFAVTSPLGVGLGIVFDAVLSDFTSVAVTAILQAIATGTLFYITFLEVLTNEINAFGDRFWKTLCVTIGVVSMASLVIISE